MAIIPGRNGKVTITDSGAATRDLTSFVDGFSDNIEPELLDSRVFGNTWFTRVYGQVDYSGSINGKFDANGSLTPEFWFNGLAGAGSTSVLTNYPNGSAAARPYTAATVYFSGYTKDQPVDDVVTWSVNFSLASGSVVLGTL